MEPAGDYTVDEKSKQAFLTEDGHENVEAMLVREGLLKRAAASMTRPTYG